MKIGRGALLTSTLTVDNDVDFLTLYQAKNLATPASSEALRKGNRDISMAEIVTAIFNAANGLVKLNASADVPLAQIPDTLTGKDADTLDGDELADIEGTMDTKIAAHAISASHRWTDEKLRKGAGAGANPDEIDLPAEAIFREGTVTDFQVNSATGTCTSPQNLNVGEVTSFVTFDVENEYAIVDFGKVVALTQWQQYGHTNNNGDGVFKIQYYNLSTHAWVDWKTGIATRATGDWSGWDTPSAISTDKIKLIATTLDSIGDSRIGELEVKY